MDFWTWGVAEISLQRANEKSPTNLTPWPASSKTVSLYRYPFGFSPRPSTSTHPHQHRGFFPVHIEVLTNGTTRVTCEIGDMEMPIVPQTTIAKGCWYTWTPFIRIPHNVKTPVVLPAAKVDTSCLGRSVAYKRSYHSKHPSEIEDRELAPPMLEIYQSGEVCRIVPSSSELIDFYSDKGPNVPAPEVRRLFTRNSNGETVFEGLELDGVCASPSSSSSSSSAAPLSSSSALSVSSLLSLSSSSVSSCSSASFSSSSSSSTILFGMDVIPLHEVTEYTSFCSVLHERTVIFSKLIYSFPRNQTPWNLLPDPKKYDLSKMTYPLVIDTPELRNREKQFEAALTVLDVDDEAKIPLQPSQLGFWWTKEEKCYQELLYSIVHGFTPDNDPDPTGVQGKCDKLFRDLQAVVTQNYQRIRSAQETLFQEAMDCLYPKITVQPTPSPAVKEIQILPAPPVVK